MDSQKNDCIDSSGQEYKSMTLKSEHKEGIESGGISHNGRKVNNDEMRGSKRRTRSQPDILERHTLSRRQSRGKSR